MTPPYIVYDSKAGELLLGTRSAEAACRRVDGLLGCAAEVVLERLELTMLEPCSRALGEELHGPFDDRPGIAGSYSGIGRLPRPASELARAHGHSFGEAATEAFAAFGPPTGATVAWRKASTRPRVSPETTDVGWAWETGKDPAAAAAAYRPWSDFLCRHQAAMYDSYSPRVELHGIWTFRLRSTTGAVAAAPYPRSELLIGLASRHARGTLELVFPHAEVGPELVADVEAVSAAFMKLRPTRLRLDSPTRRGTRKRTKLPRYP